MIPGQFTVNGTKIIGPDGSVFVPFGVNVAGLRGNGAFGFDWRGDAYGHSEDVLAWGWNTVRLSIYVSSAVSFYPKRRLGESEFRRRVNDSVDEYTVALIYLFESIDYRFLLLFGHPCTR